MRENSLGTKTPFFQSCNPEIILTGDRQDKRMGPLVVTALSNKEAA